MNGKVINTPETCNANTSLHVKFCRATKPTPTRLKLIKTKISRGTNSLTRG